MTHRAQQQLRIADQYWQQGRYNEALAGYELAIRIDPQCVEAYEGKAKVCRALAEQRHTALMLEAEEARRKAMELQGNSKENDATR